MQIDYDLKHTSDPPQTAPAEGVQSSPVVLRGAGTGPGA